MLRANEVMDEATIELVESMRWCDVRMVGVAWIEAGKSVLLTLRFLPDERKAYLLCRWVECLKIDLEFGDRHGGPPLSWEGEIKRDAQGDWQLRFDFASTGVVALRCSELEFLRAPPDDGDDLAPGRWIVSWKFHLHTKAVRDAERVFAKVAKRVGSPVRVIDSGLRGARPGTWVRAELELVGSFADAIAAILEEAGTFGSDISVKPPEGFADGSVRFRGWIDARSHCELAGVDFELRNIPTDRG